jgi:hypothetical protein
MSTDWKGGTQGRGQGRGRGGGEEGQCSACRGWIWSGMGRGGATEGKTCFGREQGPCEEEKGVERTGKGKEMGR